MTGMGCAVLAASAARSSEKGIMVESSISLSGAADAEAVGAILGGGAVEAQLVSVKIPDRMASPRRMELRVMRTTAPKP